MNPLARLVFRFDQPAREYVANPKHLTVCYSAEFNYYGVIGKPREVGCPDGARAITPPSVAPPPKWEIPQGTDKALHGVLTGLPAAPPSDADVIAAVRRAMPPRSVSQPTSRPRSVAPAG
ncbi:hypothetical protein EV193_111113 [Herbihabitans rhizosphaerae]|uniref:Uncharacterized protein n=1 Tax=Herbihabitans rhizosphaerae TaxID=1872711 RepID=A0A4Q7KIJ8_9PSEU|nr:hypothetical protein [Herbihabitans rhizosphaerae]RZS32728.1 hypothetical protein EV193_111113 [Herbihabitans rhizosphaerae]